MALGLVRWRQVRAGKSPRWRPYLRDLAKAINIPLGTSSHLSEDVLKEVEAAVAEAQAFEAQVESLEDQLARLDFSLEDGEP